MDGKQQKRSGGPNTAAGKGKSSKNSTKHGGCSRQPIIQGESRAEFEAVEAWWFAHYEDEARPLLEEAALNEWLLKRTQRNYLAVDLRLGETDPNDWTEEQMHRLHLMLRYKTAAERSFHRSMAAVERFRRTRVYEGFAQARADAREAERARQQEEEEEEAEPELTDVERMKALPPVVALPAMSQWITVRVEDGKTVTKIHPSNEELLARYEAAEVKPVRIFRLLHIKPWLPPEYEWVRKNLAGKSDAREQTMVWEEWLRAIAREKDIEGGHIGPAEPDLTWEYGFRWREKEDKKEGEAPPGFVGRIVGRPTLDRLKN